MVFLLTVCTYTYEQHDKFSALKQCIVQELTHLIMLKLHLNSLEKEDVFKVLSFRTLVIEPLCIQPKGDHLASSVKESAVGDPKVTIKFQTNRFDFGRILHLVHREEVHQRAVGCSKVNGSNILRVRSKRLHETPRGFTLKFFTTVLRDGHFFQRYFENEHC